MTTDRCEYMYKIYRQRMKEYLPGGDIMPRRVFRLLMMDANTIDDGMAALEKYFELLIAQLLEESKTATEALMSTGTTSDSIGDVQVGGKDDVGFVPGQIIQTSQSKSGHVAVHTNDGFVLGQTSQALTDTASSQATRGSRRKATRALSTDTHTEVVDLQG